MKVHILAFFILFAASFAIAGNGDNNKEKVSTNTISGKVIDKVSGEEIAGASIKVDGKVIYTDLNGNFLASVNSTKQKAIVTFISYNDLEITIDPYSPVILELESK